ncbi:MAG TPA: DUF5686 family protein [Puia sp.]|uniref:DUF5686 family protein n=1 Tax=Puia sp. TaxID=2045100 RepID=UPI002B52E35A|nr:DUF5686 family protein [Puia sp.]HVU96072.1 DUF5686 family protein [Puia sp.]
MIWRTVMAVVLLLTVSAGHAQRLIVKGIIKDEHSDERIPFASARWAVAGTGTISDSAGRFRLAESDRSVDTLIVSYVGYKIFLLPVSREMAHSFADKSPPGIIVTLQRSQYAADVVVKRTVDKGLLLWRKIVRRRPFNDRYRLNNFAYELYNRLELDLNDVNKDRLRSKRLLRPFAFVFDNVDTLQGVPFLPVYLTETLSDYFYQKRPVRKREAIKASKTLGIDNPSVTQLLGGMDQNVDFYSNYIPLFTKRFISPLSDRGDYYYHYKLVDTQWINSRRFFHLVFTPQRKGESTFEGDCWVHDTTFAIQKMNLRLNREANINFINELSLIQQFSLINDSTWFLTRDKFVVNISPLGGSKVGFIGRKTATYRNIRIDDPNVSRTLDSNRIREEIVTRAGARDRADSFWASARHEPLSPHQQAVYTTMDSLLKMPLFHTYTEWVNFIGTGYYDAGPWEFGPWYNAIYSNQLQGFRLRFDLGTNRNFSKKVILHGYLAYGFGDRRVRGEADALWVLHRDPRFTLYGMYRNDLDYGQQYYDEITSDNIFAIALRKSGIPIKFINLEEKKLELFKEWHNGFSVTLTGDDKQYDPLLHLPSKASFGKFGGDPLHTFETSIRFRWAYLEKFFQNTFYRRSLGAKYPVVSIKYTRGIKGVLNSNYEYNKLSGSISDLTTIQTFGTLYYNVFAGKTYGTLPFTFLDVAPGNELYYYNQYAFSLFNKWQYIHDKYGGANLEHNVGNGLFRFIPLTRRLKWRQFWTAKALWGSLSRENTAYNSQPGSNFQSLNGRTYLELGTGVDNIFRFFRVDCIWRILPQPLPAEGAERFGVFGSFRVAF